ncbi:MAG: fused MFS/spermidine synthase, partial [Pseudomonadota bacterium]
LWRTRQSAHKRPRADSILPDAPPSLATKLHWGVLAFVPSSLLLGLTNFISTDIASVPLLWIVPLTIYLLSFVVVFSRRGIKAHPVMVAAQPMVLLPFIAFSFINPAVLPYWVDLALHSLAFFLAVMVCHGELAKSRPHARYLTTYYLIMSFAGMLGGMFNTFVAPFLFNSVYEYPIMIAAALLLRPTLEQRDFKKWLQWGMDTAFPLGLLTAGLCLYAAVDNIGDLIDIIGTALILLVGLTYAFRRRPVNLALFTGVLLFFTFGLHTLVSNIVFQERTFFGVLSVRNTVIAEADGNFERAHELFHGTTKHGAQRLSAGHRTDPLTYYSRPGPIGQLFTEFDAGNANWHVGIVGLGAGALACYAKPGQSWDFFEIDPAVVQIARNPAYFTYLKECAPHARMMMGDARLSIAREPEKHYDLIVMDAFSSDAVPTHLLTEEALALYFTRLKENGLLAFHITNRHLVLKKVLADHSKRLNLPGLLQEFKPKTPMPLVVDTDWVVLAKSEAPLQRLRLSRLGNWQKLPLVFDMKPWTDDFTNILNVWK